jgi:succinyl-diaminopimelate desuccinylase
MGENAIHRAAGALTRLAAADPGTETVDGLEFRQSLEVVKVEGGIANNVVPDVCTVTVNRRFAPNVSIADAEAETRMVIGDADEIEVVNASVAAPPNLWDPLIAELVGSFDLGVRPKLGWTDVARFAAHGIPALNFGPGDPTVSHSAGEFVTGISLDGAYAVLGRFLGVA